MKRELVAVDKRKTELADVENHDVRSVKTAKKGEGENVKKMVAINTCMHLLPALTRGGKRRET